MPHEKEKSLSPKRQRFVDEYMVDYNASAAWVRAGYSPNGASENACRALKEPAVAAAIEELRKSISQKTGVTVDDIRRELKGIGFAPKDEVRDADKINALKLLGMDLGMFKQEGTTVPVTIVFDDPTARPEGYQRKKVEKSNGETEH